MSGNESIRVIVFALLFLLPSTIHATLIVTVPTKAGLIICADKRIEDVRGDIYVKILPIASRGFFAASGSVGVSQSVKTYNLGTMTGENQLRELFDTNSVANTYIENHRNIFESGKIDKQVWVELRHAIASEISKLHGIPTPTLSNPPVELINFPKLELKEPHLFSSTNFIYFNEKNELLHNVIYCLYDESTKTYSFQSQCLTIFDNFPFAPRRVLYFDSQNDFVRELKAGGNPQFDVFRKDKRIKPFLADDIHPESVTMVRALTSLA